MRLLLFLLSIIYGTFTSIRNNLFDYGIFKSTTHKIPIICIGNLSAGGSGKTPHTNHIAKLLSKQYNVAILSRGYGRKSKGFNYVVSSSTAISIGDEPLQLKQNNPICIVAVNNNRNKGVTKILTDYPKTDVILLDDGFQHRWIKAGLNILITPFQKPYTKDELLPLGTLRENISAAHRADIIIVSKTPINANPTRKKGMLESLHLKAHQKVYFSSINYKKYKCIDTGKYLENEANYSITLVSGIANPTTLVNHLKKHTTNVNLLRFNDHHNYNQNNITHILSEYNKDKSSKKVILTTEKDGTKLREFSKEFKGANLYYIPIDIALNEQKEFEKKILNYVANN